MKADMAERIARKMLTVTSESRTGAGKGLQRTYRILVGRWHLSWAYNRRDLAKYKREIIRELAAALRKAGVKGG